MPQDATRVPGLDACKISSFRRKGRAPLSAAWLLERLRATQTAIPERPRAYITSHLPARTLLGGERGAGFSTAPPPGRTAPLHSALRFPSQRLVSASARTYRWAPISCGRTSRAHLPQTAPGKAHRCAVQEGRPPAAEGCSPASRDTILRRQKGRVTGVWHSHSLPAGTVPV